MSELSAYRPGLVYRPYRRHPKLKGLSIGHSFFIVRRYMTTILPYCEKPKLGGNPGGGMRGKISEFSRKSRSRLLRKIFSKDSLPSCFSTLTYDDTVVWSMGLDEMSRKIHRDIKRMGDALRRRFPGCGCVWRVEWVARKYGPLKGSYVPHFHALWYIEGVPKDVIGGYIRSLWLKYTGTVNPDAYAVTYRKESFIPLDGRKQIGFYMAKYIGKDGGCPPFIGQGRHWGEIGNVPESKQITIEVDPNQSKMVLRLLRRWFASHNTGKKKKWSYIEKTVYELRPGYIFIEAIAMADLLNITEEMEKMKSGGLKE